MNRDNQPFGLVVLPLAVAIRSRDGNLTATDKAVINKAISDPLGDSPEKQVDKWVTVPAVPTDEMEVAFTEAWFAKRRCIDDIELTDAWLAAIDAAPVAPVDPLPTMTDLNLQMEQENAELRAEVERLKSACSRAEQVINGECQVGAIAKLRANVLSNDLAKLRKVADRADYWKQRAKSAEGHIWASDFKAAREAVRQVSNYADIPADQLSGRQEAHIDSVVAAVLRELNTRRAIRQPHDSRALAWCACGDGYPPAELAALGGVCENCQAAGDAGDAGPAADGTDKDRLRDEFEAWLLSEHGLVAVWLAERNCFKPFPAHLSWQAWQASRAAVAIELPQQSGMNPDWNQAIRYCRQAIEAPGLKVAP